MAYMVDDVIMMRVELKVWIDMWNGKRSNGCGSWCDVFASDVQRTNQE